MKKKNKAISLPILAAAFAVLLLLGNSSVQAQSLFKPNAHQTALFTEIKELHVSASYGSSGIQGNVAYSLFDGVALSASFTGLNQKDDPEFHKSMLGELAVLFFDSYNEPLISQFSLGYGIGKASMLDYASSNDSATFSNSFTRLYGQYTIGLTSRHIDAGVSLRVSHVYFPGYFLKEFSNISSSANMFTGEPVIFASAGLKNVRVDGQIGMPLILNDQTNANLNRFSASLGLRWIINRTFPERK